MIVKLFVCLSDSIGLAEQRPVVSDKRKLAVGRTSRQNSGKCRSHAAAKLSNAGLSCRHAAEAVIIPAKLRVRWHNANDRRRQEDEVRRKAA